MEFVAVWKFFDIEFGTEDFQIGLTVMMMAAVIAAPIVLFEVIEKTEEGREGCCWVVANKRSWKQGHPSGIIGAKYSLRWCDSVVL